MNIQIFGTKKCNDTRKAERYFKERGIKYQFIDMKEKGMSKGEFSSVAQANGGLDGMINWDGKDKDTLALIKYIAEEDRLAKVLENPQVIKTPVVRNGKQSTLGYMPEVWKCLYWAEEKYAVTPIEIMLEVINVKKGMRMEQADKEYYIPTTGEVEELHENAG